MLISEKLALESQIMAITASKPSTTPKAHSTEPRSAAADLERYTATVMETFADLDASGTGKVSRSSILKAHGGDGDGVLKWIEPDNEGMLSCESWARCLLQVPIPQSILLSSYVR